MYRIFQKILAFCLLLFWGCSGQPLSPEAFKQKENQTYYYFRFLQGREVSENIPPEWIEDLRTYPKLLKTTNYLRSFVLLVNPQWHEADENTVFNPIFCNLDDDTGEEIICTLMMPKLGTQIAIIDKVGETWRLIYIMDHYTQDKNSSNIQICNSFSENKLFFITTIHRGVSKGYFSGLQFFKLINGKVWPCLEVVREMFIYDKPENMLVGQAVSSSVMVSDRKDDFIEVTFDFNFFPNTDSRESIHEYDYSIHGRRKVIYAWDKTTKKYLLQQLDDPYSLNEQKIICFRHLNDSLFTVAYGPEIQQTITSGTLKQRTFWAKYEKEMQHFKKVLPPINH